MAKVEVRLTIRPDELTEVDEDEVPNLRMQRLLVEGDAAAELDKQAAEYEAARQRAAQERAEREKTPKTGRGQNSGE